MPFSDWLSNPDRLTVVGLLLGLLWCLVKPNPFLVPGWLYREAVVRADKWERLAMSGTDLARRAVAHLKQAVTPKREGDPNEGISEDDE